MASAQTHHGVGFGVAGGASGGADEPEAFLPEACELPVKAASKGEKLPEPSGKNSLVSSPDPVPSLPQLT